jgi:hypothetical protein
MMLTVPLSPVPSQTVNIILGGQQCQLSVYTRTGYDLTDQTLQTLIQIIYVGLTVNGTPILKTMIARDQTRLLLDRQYLGVVGDFMFTDTQGDDDPQYTGLGTRWLLIYLEAADLVGEP